jgi:hypothetical protein
MHLVIYFCGTQNTATNFKRQYNYVTGDNVRTYLVKGCEDPTVCDSGLFPDLKGFARRFTQKLFGKDKKLATTKSEDLTNIGINLDRSILRGKDDDPIESITLCGYSRGAVTCFEVARQLNQLVPDIPVDIVADQPVPGNFYQGPGTNAASVADCRDLGNLRNVSVILGSYTGTITTNTQKKVNLHVKLKFPEDDEIDAYKNSFIYVDTTLYYIKKDGSSIMVRINPDYVNSLDITPGVESTHSYPYAQITTHFDPEMQDEDTSSIHRGFYSQVLPKLPRTAHRDLIIIPKESHHQELHQELPNAPTGEEHMHMQVAKYLNKTDKDLVSPVKVKEKTAQARSTYMSEFGLPPNPFPQTSKWQSFFGLHNNDASRYFDKLHPAHKLRKGMMWGNNETLTHWWNTHDKNTSRYSTQLTKDLVDLIKKTPENNDIEPLKALFIKTEEWLIAKENSSTSRYYQVDCLRNNIYHHLVNKLKVPEQDMEKLHGDILHKQNYFLKHWTEGSKAASWFKTDETRTLDEAFKAHATAPQSEENDTILLEALQTWLNAKQGSESKRYDLVVEMTETLQEVITNCYENSVEQTQSPSM